MDIIAVVSLVNSTFIFIVYREAQKRKPNDPKLLLNRIKACH